MSDLPYTDEQVEVLRRVLEAKPPAPPEGRAKAVLQALHGAGITVTFPEPRYYAELQNGGNWVVRDRRPTGQWPATVAGFSGRDRDRYACEHADRLNREASA